MNKMISERNRKLAEKVIRGLESRNMEGHYAETKEEALKIALALIPAGSGVGWGGSVSIADIGLKDAVCSGDYTVYNRDACSTPEEKEALNFSVLGVIIFSAVQTLLQKMEYWLISMAKAIVWQRLPGGRNMC